MRLRGLMTWFPFALAAASLGRPLSVANAQDIEVVPVEKARTPENTQNSGSTAVAPGGTVFDDVVFDTGRGASGRRDKGAPTLFEWAISPKLDDEAEEPPTRMPNDTPHFTDNSRVVGLGRVMLESGYTYTTNRAAGIRTSSHAIPEELLRIGIFAEWFEARFEWNYQMTGTSEFQQRGPDGADDLGVGMRLALTEQKGWLPESALNLSMSLPTGSSAFTSNRILPEVRYHYSWELVKDKWELEANTIAYAAREDSGHDYTVFVQTANFEYSLTKDTELFFEWYGLFPHGAQGPLVLPQHYYHSGATYYFTDNFALYAHAAVGLNRHADDFYTGVGVLVRR